MTKYLIIGAYDCLSILLCSIVLIVAAPTPALAYIDPSVMTYTIQAVAGVAVALSAVLGVALRRTRKFIFRLFKIDENANKMVDPAVTPLVDSSTQPNEMRVEADERARAFKETLANGRPVKRLSWPKRFIRSLIACAFLIWTIFVFTPLELVAADSGSLQFNFFDVTTLVYVMGAVITLISAALVSLIRGKAFDVVITIIVAVGIGCYVQSLFLNSSLPVADGSPLQLSNRKTITVISTVVWVGILAAFLIFNAKKTAYCRALVLVMSVLLFTVQGVSMIGTTIEQSNSPEAQEDPLVMSTYGLNEVGAESNVTVFVLDMFDTQVLEDLIENDPNVMDEFTGFTFFRNSTGSMIPTRYAIPYLLTAKMPEPGIDFYNDYFFSTYDNNSFLDEIVENGYEITAYSDTLNTEKMEPYAANIYHTDHREFYTDKLWLELQRMALSREMPWLLKPLFWFNTNDLNLTIADSYTINDPLYGENLRSEGLTVSENTDKTFRFIHLMGAHFPYSMDAEGNAVPEDTSDELSQSKGCLGIVADYLKELKRLGLYDQSTIIITADHGRWDVTMDQLERTSSPIFLVKPVETAAEAAEPLKVSDVPTGHLDYPATVIEAVGGDSSAYGPTAFEVTDEPRDRFYWMTLHDGNRDHGMIQYVIQGDALNFDDWHLTGEKLEFLGAAQNDNL